MIHVARVYDLLKHAGAEACFPGAKRYLVDRLWPRGISKEALALDGWAKDAAPSDFLRRTYRHDPERWEEFRRAYVAELKEKPLGWRPLLEAARRGDLLLLYAARERERNNAVVLKEFLEGELRQERLE